MKTEQSTVDTYVSKFHLYIFQILIWLVLSLIDRLQGTKNEQSNVDTYVGRCHFYIHITDTFIWLMFRFLTRSIKRTDLFCFITFKSIYLNYVHYGMTFKEIISLSRFYQQNSKLPLPRINRAISW